MVADFAYVPTWSGIAHVAFVSDVFSRAITTWSGIDSSIGSVGDTLDSALTEPRSASTDQAP
ncbi:MULTISPECIES: hypothetical protein [Streptomyces]|uniref:hypothetical protein n=1 Tax=Streptomyces TaxID=1883 RepID=UPI0004E642EC|nr:hypothetical protein [Streptomyces scabiei]KFG09231.1 hypothetical protein IQ61_09590 [Streptomyces scabiei]MDX2575485.1 hypothetical protein [Streptomyces scabiei]MDX2653035.1 hypothetical protein [Streptomyces scabiei]MDX2718792.1 hypothetical protein [Streptomyces scabiei]MDX2865156.1 hypothetical protein [Streptomyces scabiei]